MKKPGIILLVLLISVYFFTGCGIFNSNESVQNPNTDQDEIVSENGEKEPDGEVLQEATGIYVGQIDGNSVEININNTPSAFVIREVENEIEKLQEGSEVKIKYIENEYGQLVLKSIEAIK